MGEGFTFTAGAVDSNSLLKSGGVYFGSLNANVYFSSEN